jgi:hypothetical protein
MIIYRLSVALVLFLPWEMARSAPPAEASSARPAVTAPASAPAPAPAPVPAEAARTRIPAIPEGFNRVTVCRTKRLLDAFTAAGLSVDVLKDLGYDGLLTPNFENVSPNAVISYTIGYAENGYLCRLCTLASPCTLADFITLSGNKPEDYSGDGKLRQRNLGLGKTKYHVTYHRYSPHEYLMCEDYGGTAISEPGKALGTVRAAVAASGHLFWTSGRVLHLPGSFFGLERTESYTLKDLEIGLQWPDDLIFKARAALDTPAIAETFLALTRIKVPPPPAVPGDTDKSLSPRQEFTTTGPLASYHLTVPKAAAALAIPALLEATLSGESRQRALRDAPEVLFTWSAAVAAGCPETSDVPDVPTLLDLIHKGVSADPTRAGAPTYQESTSSTPVYRRFLASWLELEKGKLSLSPRGQKELADHEQEAARIPSTHPAAIAKARRDARLLCVTFTSAAAAGSADIAKVTSAREAVDALVRGTVGQGSFANSIFHVVLTKAESERALAHLSWENGHIKYTGP